MWRDVFAYSVRPEIYLDADNIQGLFPALPSEKHDIQARLSSLCTDIENFNQRWVSLREQMSHESFLSFKEAIIRQSAPLAAAMGAALQSMSAPGVFEDPAHLQLMVLLADDIGVGVADNARFDSFCALARINGTHDVALSSRELCDQSAIRDICFRFPSIIYALSRRSDTFDFELIGLDLAWRTAGMLPAWQVIATNDATWQDLNMGLGRGAAVASGANLQAYMSELVKSMSTNEQDLARVATGIALFSALLKEHDNALYIIAQSLSDPRLAMAILLQERAREAQVYHENFNFEGRPLSEWFAEARENPLPLVDALARSKLIRPGAPERSPLINGLISETGPMFRIFSERDIRTIGNWISSLKNAPTESVSRLPPEVQVSANYHEVRAGDLSLGTRPEGIRSAYHLLQGRALPPGTREFAKDYCLFWLEHAKNSIDRSARSLPQMWSPGMLREWLLASHDAHAQDFSASQNMAIPPLEDVIEQTVQLAPLTLIDGAWLQGYTDISLASSLVGSRLFETYWDELGNGQWRINHPKIYRDVLAKMSITLPPTGSVAFVQDARLYEESFRLPVYWLCLGKFPLTFRPEILGMNLAMELSGVGGTYRNAHRFLTHYGLPTTFVDLHNTIDNVSTGHSAWAAQAIDSYMQSTRDFLPAEHSWARIRQGYESLAPIVENPEQLNFFAYPMREATTSGNLKPLLHRQLQSYEVAE